MRVRSAALVRAVLLVSVMSAGGCGFVGGPEPATGGDRIRAFVAAADTFITSDEPDQTNGDEKKIVSGGSPERRALVRFTVTGWEGRVGRAELRLRTSDDNDGSDDGGTIRAMSDASWPEGTLTWNQAPPGDRMRFEPLGKVTKGTWYGVDVTAAVTGNGSYSFTISSDSDDAAHYDSRESGDHAPQLVLHSTRGTSRLAASAPSGGGAQTVTLIGAGDISACDKEGAEKTADLLDTTEGTIFTAGDNDQDDGAAWRYDECFDKSWGKYKKRIRPVPGNHDYYTKGATGYYKYFGDAAGEPGRGYYSYDVGDWHVVALNSNCSEVGCGKGSKQEKWLRADLAASSKQCTAAFWHHPLFTSAEGHEGSEPVRPLFEALYDAGAEIVVNGHNHVYERFTPQDPDGDADLEKGIRAFTVGTGGGGDHYTFGDPAPTSRIRHSGTYGVLKLVLEQDGYRWQFLPVDGKTFTDSGTGTCH
jgi:hypothetical protein